MPPFLRGPTTNASFSKICDIFKRQRRYNELGQGAGQPSKDPSGCEERERRGSSWTQPRTEHVLQIVCYGADGMRRAGSAREIGVLYTSSTLGVLNLVLMEVNDRNNFANKKFLWPRVIGPSRDASGAEEHVVILGDQGLRNRRAAMAERIVIQETRVLVLAWPQ